jgi:hypothetical protein
MYLTPLHPVRINGLPFLLRGVFGRWDVLATWLCVGS